MRHVRRVNLDKDPPASVDTTPGDTSSSTHNGESVAEDDFPGHTVLKQDGLSPRVTVNLRGLEWFVYNRSPAYDAVLAAVLNSSQDEYGQNTSNNGAFSQNSADRSALKVPPGHKSPLGSSEALKEDVGPNPSDSASTSGQNSSGDERHVGDLPGFIRLLPIRIDCKKGGMVMGNEHTRCVLVAKFDTAWGFIDARSSNPRDLYKQSFDFELANFTTSFRPNEDYKRSILEAASRREAANEKDKPENKNLRGSAKKRQKTHALQKLFGLVPHMKDSVNSFMEHDARAKTVASTQDPTQMKWLGLSRYLDDEDGQIELDRWKSIEYAQVNTIANCPKLGMSFFYDVPGKVSVHHSESPTRSEQETRNMNGSLPPEWGLHIIVGGGLIHYGPWADRQRADLQAFFFPPAYVTWTPSRQLRKGQLRQSTQFKIQIVLDEAVVLRIHTREESKDWKWRDHHKTTETEARRSRKERKPKEHKRDSSDSIMRPAGWIDVTVATNSCVTYKMDIFAGDSGFENKLSLDIPSLHIFTSVNHGLFLRSESLTMTCDLDTPLRWNARRIWSFDMNWEAFELFLIRDHAFLLVDLISDWTSGPSEEYLTFIPFIYRFKLRFPQFKVYLNINDANIIDSPAQLDANAFMLLGGDCLDAQLTIPLVNYRPSKNELAFEASVSNMHLELLTPTWNTLHLLLKDKRIAELDKLSATGSYTYFTSTSPSQTEILILDLHGSGPTVHFFGFLIRYFMVFQKNYFGEDMHFQTLEEYQQKIGCTGADLGASREARYVKPSNDLDVILSIEADDASIILPSELYSAQSNVNATVSSVHIDLRFTNYYMDLEIHSSPLAFTNGSFGYNSGLSESDESNTQIFVASLDVSGHRLFGLPPSEPTYVCNWDLAAGTVTGDCSLEFVGALARAGRAIAFQFSDSENTLSPVNTSLIHDITFLRVTLDSLRLSVRVNTAAMLLEIERVNLQFNDWARLRFSESLRVQLPGVQLSIIDAVSATRQRRGSETKALTHGILNTSVDIDLAISKAHFREQRELQQNHIDLHDSRSHRIPWLLVSVPGKLTLGGSSRVKPHPPAMPIPPIPEPLKPSFGYETFFGSSEHESLSAAFRNSAFGADSTLADRGCNSKRTNKLGKESLAEAKVAFSSSFDTPYFSLQHLLPDLHLLPTDILPSTTKQSDTEVFDEDSWEAPEDGNPRTYLSVSFGSGILSYCTPHALKVGNDLIKGLQPRHPEHILDEIQLASIARVKDYLTHSGASPCVQLLLKVPSVAVRIATQSRDHHHGIHLQTHEIRASTMQVTGKLHPKTQKSDTTGSDSTTILQVSLQEARFTIRGRDEHCLDDQARLDLDLDSPAFWFVRNGQLSSQLQVKSFKVISLNRRVQQLSALLNESTTLFSALAKDFSDTIASGRRKLQAFVYELAVNHEASADPVFLTTVSYVLRAAPKHLRSTDTWKIVSRLRYIYNNLSLPERGILQSQCCQLHFPVAEDEVQQVTASLNRWRGWDLVQVNASAFMREIYGSETPEAGFAVSKLRLEFGVNVGLFAAVVDPGPEQNEVQVKQLLTSVSSNVLTTKEASRLEHPLVRDSTVGLCCDHIFVHLNWEICELLEDLLQVDRSDAYKDVGGSMHLTTTEPPPVTSSKILHRLHCVLSLEAMELEFQSMNLTAASLSQSVGASLLIDQVSGNEFSVTPTLNAHLIASKVSHQLRPLALVQIIGPSLHGSLHVKDRWQGRVRLWKGGAFCNRIGLEIQEDALGLLGVADLLLKDEATFFKRMKEKMASSSTEVPKWRESAQVERQAKDEFNATLLLEEYGCTVTLLSSLRYTVRGTVARSTISSTRAAQLEFLVDFDIKQHHHALENHTSSSSEVISGFVLPPLNGRVTAVKRINDYTVVVHTAVERVSLDASAVYLILTAFSRQEVSRFRQALVRDLAVVKANYRELLGNQPQRNPSGTAAASSVLYNVNFAVDGLNITATTGKASKQAARLSFTLGCTSVHIRNCDQEGESKLLFSEISTEVESIGLLLERFDGTVGHSCGDVTLRASFVGTSKPNEDETTVRCFEISMIGPEINLFANTAPLIVDILGYLQQKFKNFNVSEEIHTLRARRHRSKSQARLLVADSSAPKDELELADVLFNSMYSVELKEIQVSWRIGDLVPISPGHEVEDLVFSIERVHLSTKKMNAARLLIGNLQLQMVPTSQSSKIRSSNSALMPEVVFNAAYLSTQSDRRLAFQAVGKSLDLRLTSKFVLPASDLQRSIGHATEDLREVVAGWNASLLQDEQNDRKLFGNKRLASVLVDADFAGAVVYLQGTVGAKSPTGIYSPQQTSQSFSPRDEGFQRPRDSMYTAVLRTPGIAFKVEYQDLGKPNRSLNAEIKVDASSNTLQPTIVPLILSLTSSVQEIVQEKTEGPQKAAIRTSPTKTVNDDNVAMTDPVAILGDCKLNLGLRICKQQFGLTCQPLAKVAAAAEFEDIYITVNTVQIEDQDRFFALSARITHLQSTVQHAYSQESTGSFVAEVIELSLMNSKHVSDLKGISAILNLGPMKVVVNARQLHDFFLFREIWLPRDIFAQDTRPESSPAEAHPIVMQRYQQAAAASPFPWNATLSISELDLELDMGSSLGRGSFHISKLWTSSTKLSNWEQNLCFGFDAVGIESAGRLSCSVGLQNMRIRTSIKWHETNEISKQTPLIQASMGFQHLQLKAAFEYQTFLVATFSALDFMMYNVRDLTSKYGDRLVCTVEGDQVQAYCTTQTSAQVVALYQSFQRLIQEKRQAYESSLRDIRRFYQNERGIQVPIESSTREITKVSDQPGEKLPIQLQTNVVVSLKYINVGAYPRAFVDNNIFKLNALDASARFSVLVEGGKIRSSLGMSLGQVRVALSPISRQLDSNAFEDISVDDVVRYSTNSRGGTILKVPRVVAIMQTWQAAQATQIEYLFKSSFEGKVEVGWNINRINFIRGMWNSHSQVLAARLGKSLPQSAVQITGVPTAEDNGASGKNKKGKITAVVNVPLSKYSYTAREPPVIEAPQLREMGEATPPLEWIGLHRDRLPNVTHQIIIVPLLEVAKEVEDAYGRILGAS